VTRFGDYTLKRQLGAGGMGSVYLAVRDADDTVVALKIVDPATSGADDSTFRFAREAKVMMSLDHPNIVRAYSIGTIEGKFYLSTEFVPGDDLLACIKRDGRIEERECLRIMRQVAEGLAYGAERDIVHRDVKPSNILIAPDGTAKLTDLGLAVLAGREDLRLTAPGTVLGSPPFMSPEQAMGERELDVRSDIYSLGCTFYCALCGRAPFGTGGNPVVIMQKHLRDAPAPPRQFVRSLSAETESLILKCLAKSPDDRFRNYAELTAAIDAATAASEAAPPPPPAQPARAAAGAVPRRATTRLRFEDDEPSARPAPKTPAPGWLPPPPSDSGPPKAMPLMPAASAPPVARQVRPGDPGTAQFSRNAPGPSERGIPTTLKVLVALLGLVTLGLVAVVVFVL
jgi:serine/threonine-protein kinase